MQQIVRWWVLACIGVFPGTGLARAVRVFVGLEARICYTLPMFIHHVFITGCSDRGAWPWRKPVFLNA
jgi:hypothetical protein